MDTGLIGYLGARAVRHAVMALGLEAGPVPTPLLPRVVNRVREVARIPEFAIYVLVQV